MSYPVTLPELIKLQTTLQEAGAKEPRRVVTGAHLQLTEEQADVIIALCSGKPVREAGQ